MFSFRSFLLTQSQFSLFSSFHIVFWYSFVLYTNQKKEKRKPEVYKQIYQIIFVSIL